MRRFAIQNLLKPNAQARDVSDLHRSKYDWYLKLRSIYRTVYIADTCEC